MWATVPEKSQPMMEPGTERPGIEACFQSENKAEPFRLCCVGQSRSLPLTRRVLGYISSLDEDIAILELGKGNLSDRSGFALIDAIVFVRSSKMSTNLVCSSRNRPRRGHA